MTNINRQDIEKQLTSEIALITRQSADAIEPGTSLHTLGIDSMGFVEVLVFIEKQYGLKLIETGMTREDFETISSLAECIERELKQSDIS